MSLRDATAAIQLMQSEPHDKIADEVVELTPEELQVIVGLLVKHAQGRGQDNSVVRGLVVKLMKIRSTTIMVKMLDDDNWGDG